MEIRIKETEALQLRDRAPDHKKKSVNLKAIENYREVTHNLVGVIVQEKGDLLKGLTQERITKAFFEVQIGKWENQCRAKKSNSP